MITTPRPNAFFDWSEESVAELRRLHLRGDSASQIASALAAMFGWPLTRSAVIGKRMRLGLTRSEASKLAMRTASSNRLVARKAMEIDRQRRVTEREAARLAKLKRLQADQKPKSKEDNVILLSSRIHPDTFALSPKTMMDPCFRGCRWPLERTAYNGDMLFCCNDKSDPLDSYCTAHKQRAYQKTRTAAQIKADQALREVRIANARKMGLRQALDFRAKRAAR